jgi:hypothetical protein
LARIGQFPNFLRFFKSKSAVLSGRRDVIVDDVTSRLPAERSRGGEEPTGQVWRGSVQPLAGQFGTDPQTDPQTFGFIDKMCRNKRDNNGIIYDRTGTVATRKSARKSEIQMIQQLFRVFQCIILIDGDSAALRLGITIIPVWYGQGSA